MKREEAIKMLKQLVDMLSDDFGDSELCEDALQMAITALQNQPVWIPVSEMLPEKMVKMFLFGMSTSDMVITIVCIRPMG